MSKFNAIVEVNVLNYLNMDCSPEQEQGRAKIDNNEMVSTETIYQYVWHDKRKGGTLYKHLRTKGKKYKKRGHLNNNRGLMAGRVDIYKRLAIVDAKNRVRDTEIDLVIGQNHKGALFTINNRAAGVLFKDKIESKKASVIELKTIALLQDCKLLYKIIVSDNGKEFANHKAIANALEIDFFFAKPYHSWERGANENLNVLIKQYFPKKTTGVRLN